MRMHRLSSAWLASLAALLAIGHSPACEAAEPQAAFAFKDGWVEFAVRQDGQPVANALIQVIDERGTDFAQGETGEEGQAAFPLPRGSWFMVEIKTGNRSADPIRLYKMDEGIEPARVLLSYGLRPCCRFKSAPTAATDPRVPGWLFPAAVSAGLVLIATIRIVTQCRSRRLSNLFGGR